MEDVLEKGFKYHRQTYRTLQYSVYKVAATREARRTSRSRSVTSNAQNNFSMQQLNTSTGTSGAHSCEGVCEGQNSSALTLCLSLKESDTRTSDAGESEVLVGTRNTHKGDSRNVDQQRVHCGNTHTVGKGMLPRTSSPSLRVSASADGYGIL